MSADAEVPLDAVTFDFWYTLCYERGAHGELLDALASG